MEVVGASPPLHHRLQGQCQWDIIANGGGWSGCSALVEENSLRHAESSPSGLALVGGLQKVLELDAHKTRASATRRGRGFNTTRSSRPKGARGFGRSLASLMASYGMSLDSDCSSSRWTGQR